MVWRRLVDARLSNSTVGVLRVLSMLLGVRAPTIPPYSTDDIIYITQISFLVGHGL
jgi:hypothetical protein